MKTAQDKNQATMKRLFKEYKGEVCCFSQISGRKKRPQEGALCSEEAGASRVRLLAGWRAWAGQFYVCVKDRLTFLSLASLSCS